MAAFRKTFAGTSDLLEQRNANRSQNLPALRETTVNEPITHKCGKWSVTLREQPHVALRWQCIVMDGFMPVTDVVSLDQQSSIHRAAVLVGGNPDDWLEAFGFLNRGAT